MITFTYDNVTFLSYAGFVIIRSIIPYHWIEAELNYSTYITRGGCLKNNSTVIARGGIYI